VAAWTGVSERTVQDAATVQEHDPHLFTRVKAGEIPAHRAAERVRRRLRDAELELAPPLPEGPFELLYADPPWQLGSPESSRAPERHYPTMALEEIKALAPPVADDACLYLWVPNCRLLEGLEVMAALARVATSRCCFSVACARSGLSLSIGLRLGSWPSC
jgi:hypothetical protein